MTDTPTPLASAEGGRRGRLSIAAALFALALVLRLVGIDHQLPHAGEPDPYIVQQADALIDGGITDRYRAGWKYPHLVATVVALVPAEEIQTPPAGASLADHKEVATKLRLRSRKVVAVISSLAAPLTYVIAARFLLGRFAILAGLLVATSLLHICFSVQARPHGPVSATCALGLLAALRWREKPTWGRTVWMGLGAAAAVSTLHSGLAILAPCGAALLGLLKEPGARARTLLQTLLALAIIGSAAGWFYMRAADGYGFDPNMKPGEIAKRHGGLGDEELDKIAGTGRSKDAAFEGRTVLFFNGHAVPVDLFNGTGFLVAWKTLSEYDPVVLFFALVGLLGALALAMRRGGEGHANARSAAWITIAFGGPALLMYGLYQLSTDRFYMLLFPPTCMIAAYGMQRFGTAPRLRGALRAIVAAGVLAGLAASIAAAGLRLRPDTYTLTADLVTEMGANDPLIYTAELVGLPLMSGPDSFAHESIWARGPWETYQWTLMNPGKRKVLGERLANPQPNPAPAEEAARRLGVRIQPASIGTRFAMFHAEDKAAAAGKALTEADPDVILFSTSRALGKGALGPDAIRNAWAAAIEGDGRWYLADTVENSKYDDDAIPLGYKLGFLNVFTNWHLGPRIEVWKRR